MTQPPYGPPGQPPHGPPPGQPNYGPPPGQPPYGPPPGQPGYPPPGQPYPGQPHPQARQKKPLYKRTWFLVLAGLLLVGILGSALGGGSEGGSNSATAASPSAGASSAEAAPTSEAAPEAETEAPEPANPGIGQPAADGKFNFVVNGIDCNTTEIGDQYFGTTAQGTFCIVDLSISNIGNEPQSFFGDNAKLYNAEKQEFSADTEAAIYLEDSASLYEEINPGNTLNSKVVFDVPVGTTPTAIELHDSAFSGGVTVNLQ